MMLQVNLQLRFYSTLTEKTVKHSDFSRQFQAFINQSRACRFYRALQATWIPFCTLYECYCMCIAHAKWRSRQSKFRTTLSNVIVLVSHRFRPTDELGSHDSSPDWQIRRSKSRENFQRSIFCCKLKSFREDNKITSIAPVIVERPS